MKTIYKYPLAVTDGQAVLMPVGAEILSVQCQKDQLCLWAAVNPNEQMQPKVIRIYGTGHPIPKSENMRFIGTAQQFDGQLVWHVFEQTP